MSDSINALVISEQQSAVAGETSADTTTPVAEPATSATSVVPDLVAEALAVQATATGADAQALKAVKAAVKKLVLVTAGSDPDPRNWRDYGARMLELTAPHGGLVEFLEDVKSFAYTWCNIRVNKEDLERVGADKATMMTAVASAFDPIFGDKEKLSGAEKKVVDFISLVSMLDPREMEATLANVEGIYAGHELAVPEAVAKKVAERREVCEKRAKIMAFEHPHFAEGLSMAEKVDALEKLGYEVDRRDERGNVVMTALHPTKKDPKTGAPLAWHVTVFKDRPQNERRDGARDERGHQREDSPRRQFGDEVRHTGMADALSAVNEGGKPSRDPRRGKHGGKKSHQKMALTARGDESDGEGNE